MAHRPAPTRRLRRRVAALLRASHFPPTLTVTAIAGVLAVEAGRGRSTVWVVLAVLAGQLSVGWSNDVVDRHRDRRAGRVDKPIVAGDVAARTVGLAALAALAASVPLSLASGWRAAAAHLAAVAVAWGYNVGLKATAASPLPYAVAFGALPAFVTLGLPGHPLPPAWWVAAGALLGTGAHFVNTLPDLAEDRRLGVRGLPQRLGRRPSLLAGAALLGAAVAVVALAPAGGVTAAGAAGLAAAAAALLGIVAAAASGRERPAWYLTLLLAVLSVALFVTAA